MLNRTRAHFVQRKSDAYRTLDRGGLDADGARIVRQYLDAFYTAIESDPAFYRPVVTATDTTAYADASRGAAACPGISTVPVGTPVGEPQGANGDMVQVMLLDALWRWAPPVKCPGMQKGPVWIDKRAIGKDYPK